MPVDLTNALATGEALNIHLISGKEGSGFGSGCNLGLQWLADNEWDSWVWILNPDVILSEGNELARLNRIQRDLPNQAIVGTAVRNSNGTPEESAGWIDTGLCFRKRATVSLSNEDYIHNTSTLVNVDWVSGCNMLLKPSSHSSPPRFDEQFPLYYEDLDFCLRQAQNGSSILWTDAITIHHERGGGSQTPSQRRLRLSTIGYIRFLQRHRPRWQLHLRSARLLGLALLRLPFQPKLRIAVLQGWWEAIRLPIR